MARSMMDQINHLLRPLRTRVANLVARATVQLVDDDKAMQSVQLGVLAGEDVDDGERFQPYGLSSVPLAGAEAVVVFPGGDRGHPLVVAVDDRRHRPTGLEAGEVAVYNNAGAQVLLTKDGDIVVTPAPGRHVLLGSEAATAAAALATELADLKTRIAAWIPVPMDGGASLKPVFAAWPTPGATKVKAE